MTIWLNRLKKMRRRKGSGNFNLKLMKLMQTFRGSILKFCMLLRAICILVEFDGLFIWTKWLIQIEGRGGWHKAKDSCGWKWNTKHFPSGNLIFMMLQQMLNSLMWGNVNRTKVFSLSYFALSAWCNLNNWTFATCYTSRCFMFLFLLHSKLLSSWKSSFMNNLVGHYCSSDRKSRDKPSWSFFSDPWTPDESKK